jgi:ligand-binding SRPBCC domain-containing protein
MPVIELTTIIDAPVTRCFDLARSIDLHKLSTSGTEEEAVAGVTSGLIGADEEVTWKARHFGITQRLTSRITVFNQPYHFRDEMIKGAFKMISHDHVFEPMENKTVMHDRFQFESPAGMLGVLFNRFCLTGYLRNLLMKRNAIIKKTAEGEQWQKILNV